MADGFELERALRGAEGPRAIPAGVRARMASTLAARAWVDQPRDAGALVGAMELEGALHAIDRPRPIPAAARARLAAQLTAPRRRLRRALSVAAAVALLAAGGVALLRPTPGPDLAEPAAPSLPRLALPPGRAPDAPPAGVSFVPPDTIDGIANPGAGFGGGEAGSGRGPAPPYMDGAISAPPAYAAGDGGDVGPSAPIGPPVAVGVVGGDAAAERGFERYLAALNRAGGIRGRTFEMVPISPERPAPAHVLVTVNLSSSPIASGGAPSWTRGPILEALTATGSVLRGNVFGFASPPERQAHLVADRVYPARVGDPRTAAIYHGEDPLFGEVVPAAIEQVLRARGVTPVRIPYDPDGPVVTVPADAAFLSLPTQDAARWLDATQAYRPARGLAGIYSLMEPGLLPLLDGRDVSIVGPYGRPEDLESLSRDFNGGSLDYTLGHAHGWITAKHLAVAVWRSGTADMVRTIRSLRGYADGFTPAYEVRAGTNERTPEGMLFGVEDGAFTTRSGFLRDPF